MDKSMQIKCRKQTQKRKNKHAWRVAAMMTSNGKKQEK